MTAETSIIVAWRSNGDADREANLECVLDWLAPLGLPLILASDGGEPGDLFNRSRAFNNGRALSPSEVYIWAEADMLVDHDQLMMGAEYARRTPGLLVPFTRWRALGPEATYLVREGVDPAKVRADRTMDDGQAVGAVGICSERSMETIGRWDERFKAHGYDDRAMYYAFRKACGPGTYVEGDAHALWHPPAYSPWERVTAAADAANYAESEVQATVANRARMRKYIAAETPERVRELTGGAE